MLHRTFIFSILTALVTLGTLSGCASKKGLSGKGAPTKSEVEYYNEGRKYILSQRYDMAEKALNDLHTYYPISRYAQDALLELIYVKYMQSEYPAAVLAADRFIRLYPNHRHADYALYAKGVANMNSGFGGLMKYTNLKKAHRDTAYLSLAFENLQALVGNYPQSVYTPDAISRMYHIYNQLAEHEMNVARWYIKRKAYVAALERARWVFQYYPQSVQTPEAIATLAYTHDKLGNGDLSEKYKQLLRLNYPSLIRNSRVDLTAARTDASWFNKATLGVLGRSQASVKLDPTKAQDTRQQTISRRSAQPQQNVPSPPDTKQKPVGMPSLSTGSALSIGLGLPQTNPTASSSDATTNSRNTAVLAPESAQIETNAPVTTIQTDKDAAPNTPDSNQGE